MYVDTHCHLTPSFYKDKVFEVAKRAYDENVKLIITIGTNLIDSVECIEISKKLNYVYAAIGIHPHDTKNINGFDDILKLMKLAKDNKKVVAIGEIGLDFFKNYSPQDVQERYFRMQINAARELNLPIIIHDRDAHDEVYKILKEEKAYEVGGVFHCYSGDYDFAKKIFDLNFLVSFPGTITFKKNKEKAESLIKKIPLDKILTETDAPFLTPEPFRGKQNEPMYVKYVAKKIAEIKKLDEIEVCKKIIENVKSLFGFEGKLNID